MKILITGASGYVGNNLAHTLAGMGNEVHALIRLDAAKEILQHSNIRIMKGDILDKESLSAAMKGCRQVYHAAAKVGAWARDPSDFYKVNVKGTLNVLEAASRAGVEKLVYTSSCGVLGPSVNEPVNEKHIRTTRFGIDYDLSKKMGEDAVMQFDKKGMQAVIVYPSKIYGPGNISHSITANAVIDKFLKKGIAFIPSPGTFKVCFAFIEDVINGHILAMQKGKNGEKYILGGNNISYLDFFERIRTIANSKGKILPVSKKIIETWAGLQLLNYRITGHPPAFTPQSVNYIFSDYTFSSEKAIRELSYPVTPLDEAIEKTIHFLQQPTITKKK